MGEQFRVELSALEEFAGFADGQAEEAPGQESLAGDPVFGWPNLPGAYNLAHSHYATWQQMRKLVHDIKGGLYASGSGAREVVGNYRDADDKAAARSRAVENALDDWQQRGGPDAPRGQGQHGQSPQGQPGQGGQGGYGQQGSQGQGQGPQPSPSGTEPSGADYPHPDPSGGGGGY